MVLVVRCQHASGACQSHFCSVLSLCEASRKYVELSPSTPLFLTLRFHEKDLTPTPNLVQIRLILPPLGHILSLLGGSTPTPLPPLQCNWVSQSHLWGSGGFAMLELFWGPPSTPPFTPKSSVFLKLSPSFVVQVVHVPSLTQKKASGNSSTPTNQPEACTLHTCYFCEKEGTHTNSISWSSKKLSPSFVVQVAHVVS
jgi:hypothetical protein